MVSMQQASLDDEDTVVPSYTMPGWPLLEQLDQRLTEGSYSREVCRQLLQDAQKDLEARFFAEENIEVLVRSRARFDVVIEKSCKTSEAAA